MFRYVDALCLLPLYMYPKTNTHTPATWEILDIKNLTLNKTLNGNYHSQITLPEAVSVIVLENILL